MKRDAIVEHDGEAIQCGFPVHYGFGPAFADVAKGQKQELDGSFIGRECAGPPQLTTALCHSLQHRFLTASLALLSALKTTLNSDGELSNSILARRAHDGQRRDAMFKNGLPDRL